MAAKSDDSLLTKGYPNGSKIDSQFANLNLNQNHNCLNIQINNSFNSNKRQNNDVPSHLTSSKYMNDLHEEKKNQLNEKSNPDKINSSTLSLHISAYENDMKVDNLIEQTSASKKLDHDLKSLKRLPLDSETINTLFEIPRQQKDEEKKPEVMQFKATQKLIDPNQENLSKVGNKNVFGKLEFEKIKEKANTLFKEEKYNKAIEVYTQLLQFSNLSPEDQAVIYSNRSASYLMIGNKDSLDMAAKDANKAMDCWPAWWKGYYRFARVFASQENWHKAEILLKQTLLLNSESKLVREELSYIRHKAAKISIGDHIVSGQKPKSLEEMKKMLCSRYNLSEDTLSNSEKLSQSLSEELVLIIKGHQHKFGIFVSKDYKKAAEFYLKAADMGNSEAMFQMGKMNFDGNGMKKDYSESMKWFLKAASSDPTTNMWGINDAQHALGLAYEYGIGVNKDYQKAAKWYEKAVKKGFIASANKLGELYSKGLGVEKSEIKAFYHFKFGADEGDTEAMVNLANSYIIAAGTELKMPTEEGIKEGKRWLQIAAKMGDENAIEELQKCQNLTPEDAYYLKTGPLKNVEKKHSCDGNCPLDYEQFGEYIEDAAKKGSKTAQVHMEIWKYMNEALEAFKKNDSAKVIQALSKAIRLNSEIVQIPNFYIKMIEARVKEYPNELDAIICEIQLDDEECEVKRQFVEKAFKLFPDDECLAAMLCYTYNNSHNPKLALEHVEMTLKRHPNSLTLLFWHICILYTQERLTPKLINASQVFLAAAPEDHPNVPACHYYKAEYYGVMKNWQKCVESFADGLAAEKKQLPCFLPYEYVGKRAMEVYHHMSIEKINNRQRSVLKEEYCQESKKVDPKRKYLISQNRGTIKAYLKDYGSSTSSSNIASMPNISSNPPAWSSLKKITLKDMDLSKERIYKKCILEAQIIDWAVFGTFVETVIEDRNGDIHRLTISNWPKTDDKNRDILEAMKMFRPNIKISIANPFYRIQETAKKDIYVDDPRNIKFDFSKIGKFCHVCGKEAKTLPSCSNCKMALYCSKECQKLDWIEFNHKEICENLKMFATLM